MGNAFIVLEISDSYSGLPFCDVWRSAIIQDKADGCVYSVNLNQYGKSTTGVIFSLEHKSFSSPKYYSNKNKVLSDWTKGDEIAIE